MKLYGFQPGGHGEYSAFVLAENEAQAREFVRQELKRKELDWDRPNMDGFETSYYHVLGANIGEVLFNAND